MLPKENSQKLAEKTREMSAMGPIIVNETTSTVAGWLKTWRTQEIWKIVKISGKFREI